MNSRLTLQVRPVVSSTTRTDAARCCESSLNDGSPVLLGVPINFDANVRMCDQNIQETLASRSRAVAFNVALPVSKSTSGMLTINPRTVSRVSRIWLS